MKVFINKDQKICYNLDLDELSTWISGTPGEMARSTFFYLQEAGHFYCGSHFYTERENLKSYLILLTTGGHGHLTYREIEYDLIPGSVFFLKCEEYQRYQTSGNYWESIWIHFDGAISSGYFSRFFEACGRCVVILSHPEPVREAMERIIELGRWGGLYTDIMTPKLVVDILTELMIAATGVGAGTAQLPRPVLQAMSIMQNEFTRNITLDDLAHATSLNKQYLHKLFKKHSGITPREFLAAVRVDRAKELLRFTDMSVSEIADALGMENASYFTRVFKAASHTTPSDYRKTWNQGK